MTVEVLTISSKFTEELLCMVNIKSLEKHNQYIKVDQFFIFGGVSCKCSFKEVSIKDLYKYQLPYEHFILAAKSLEELLLTNNKFKNKVKGDIWNIINNPYFPDGKLILDYKSGIVTKCYYKNESV